MKEVCQALRLHPKDNVATLLAQVKQREKVAIKNRAGSTSAVNIKALEDIPAGHKIALEEIPRGAEIFKYGEVIGRATLFIDKGQWVHIHNMESLRGRGDKDELG